MASNLRVTVPVEGVWFDVEESDLGSVRTYWIDGKTAVQIRVVRLPSHEKWVALVAWHLASKANNTQEFGPYQQRETAESISIAVGIGLATVLQPKHISQAPGAVTSGGD